MFGVCGRTFTFTLTDMSEASLPRVGPRNFPVYSLPFVSARSPPSSKSQVRHGVQKVAEMSEHLCIFAAERLQPGCNANTSRRWAN